MPPPRRFKAPSADRAVLADPPFDRVPELVAANRRLLDRTDVVVGGLPLAEFRALARREALAAARMYAPVPGRAESPPDAPLLLAGHQPELSHPGVWAKNFALHGLARAVGGTPLNLVVDNDTLKHTALPVPVRDARDPAAVRLESVPFDRFGGEAPYEDRGVLDADTFRTFADRVGPLTKGWGFDPLLPRAWPGAVAAAGPVGERFARVRRCWERAWGCENLELPVGRLAHTESFARFVRHLAADLPRFRAAYNGAVRAYRAAHGIASRSHPVPDLAADEAPFWGPPGPDGRRGRVTAADLADPAAVRPRALTLTLFARVGLGDFFVHGIGGGKYDEVTDAIVRDYFGIDPPAFQVVSATLHLPLPTFPTTPNDVRALRRRERDLYWNPQRHLPRGDGDRPAVRALTHRHDVLAAVEPPDRPGRRQRFRDLRDVGDRLRPFVAGRAAEARDWTARAGHEAAANAVLLRRDFAWVLYPEAVLRPFLQGFL